MIFKNTSVFRQEALNFLNDGFYCGDPPGTSEYFKYWNEQARRCQEGYEVDGVKITGYHYFYLNFCRIKLTEESLEEGKSKKKKKIGTKKFIFPDFWDGDYDYFWAVEIARNGITQKELDKLQLENNPTDLDGGNHIVLVKRRRAGYSYKNASMAACNYTFNRGSLTIIGAYETKYLYPRGTMTMTSEYLNFIDANTAWSKRRLISTREHIKSGFKEVVNGVEIIKGYQSEITAISFKDKPDAARGKDASLILLEECGTMAGLKSVYAATLPSVQDGNITTGLMILFGTGGAMQSGILDFESMFYDPETYDFLPFNNVWDESAIGTCGYFFPDYQNKVGFIDKEGNSDKKGAKLYAEGLRDSIRRTAKDPQAIDLHIVERPFCPREGFLQATNNIFPVADLNAWRNKLLITGLSKNIAVHGNLLKVDGEVKFKPSESVRPIVDFPPKNTSDLTGCVTVYQTPYRDASGKAPSGLYIVCCDPYAHDKSTGVSIGATYVIKRMNNFSQPDDMIVASYVGRPASQDQYNDILFMLAEYYNAKIGFENDRGNIIDYAKYHRKLNWLNEEFEIVDKTSNIRFGKLGRKFGISMSTKDRKGQAAIYLRDWLLTKRGKDETGEYSYNFNFIYDIALLDELIKYNYDGNFDRVSALYIGMYYLKELYRKDEELVLEEEFSGGLFDRNLF